MPESPQEKPVYSTEQKKNKRGLIMVNTGAGKGKTTAALGNAMRAAGNGMRVSIIQFIKGKWKSGESISASQLEPPIEFIPMGEGFTWNTQNRERDCVIAHKAWEVCKQKMLSGDYDLVVMDEINYVIDYGYLDLAPILEALSEKPKMTHVILTGRNAKAELIEMADLVTEMTEVKHPFKTEGILAQKGIEF